MTRNPPAFPYVLDPSKIYDDDTVQDGMFLRDYFAAKAMQAILIDLFKIPEEAARLAYLAADAMLAQRQKK